jgi:hypothetical protein
MSDSFMFHPPTTEAKQQKDPSRSQAMPEQARELSPLVSAWAGTARAGAAGDGAPPRGNNGARLSLAHLHSIYGNQTILRMLNSSREASQHPLHRPSLRARNSRNRPSVSYAESRFAVQRESDTAAVSINGEKLQDLSAPPGDGANENVENPDLALAQIEQGAPTGAGGDSASGQTNTGQKPEEEEGAVQAFAVPAAQHPGVISPSRVLARLGHGQPLSHGLRADMETAFASDFSHVRVHNDQSAAALAATLGAHAYTVGEHVAFAPGRYHPETAGTRRLVAHELTHVVQQRHGLSGNILRQGIGESGDSYEQQAEQMASRICDNANPLVQRASAIPASAPASPAALQCFSGSDAASYAKTWALKTNPEYQRFGDDCTNFVSQAMKAGGWTYNYGKDRCDERKEDYVWWYKKLDWPGSTCTNWKGDAITASHTWGGADNFRKFLQASGRATTAANISDLELGDVLQRDHGDGTMHHSMVVTKKDTDTVNDKLIKQIWLSYHTNDTLDKKFWGPDGILDKTPEGWKYYAWRMK